MADFQIVVNRLPSPAVAGDFASSNPRKSMDAGPSDIQADLTNGVVVGNFVWVDDAGYAHNTKPGSGVARLGIVARDSNHSVYKQTFTSAGSLVIPPGYAVTVYTDVDIWVASTVAVAATQQKAFANLTTGAMQPGAAGATITGCVETPWVIVTPATLVGDLVKISFGG